MRRIMTGLTAIGLGLQGCGPTSANSNAAKSNRDVAEDGGNTLNAAAPANSTVGESVPGAMTAGDATVLANAEVRRMLPRMDLRTRTIRAVEDDDHWSVMYESPDDLSRGGPVRVQVDKRTRRAAIVQMPN